MLPLQFLCILNRFSHFLYRSKYQLGLPLNRLIIKGKLSTSSNDIFVSYVSSIINRWFHEVNICLISLKRGH